MVLSILTFLCILLRCYAVPVTSDKNAMHYLKKYGYLDFRGHSASILDENSAISALKDFQRFAGLNQTGELDNDTIDMMGKPRCGVKDIVGHSALGRRKSCVRQGTREREDESGPPCNIYVAPDLCQDAAIDVVTRTQNGNTYVFKGDFYWKVLSEGIADGYPRSISSDWDGLEGNLDASLTWANGKTFFFKDGRYWRFTNKEMDPGYPKLISTGFDGIPDRIDAALVWSGNGKTYFFKGYQYWWFDSYNDPPVSAKYPQPISIWKGVPNDLDAAFQWENGKTYFFKGEKYYRFNDHNITVDTADPSYPRFTSIWWFDCQSISH